ncbi:UFGT [Symbiodinium sp. KB8]|nr:UFGT [Symbiodinium sp. KB8]
MKRGAPTSDADIDGLLEGFTSTSFERKRDASLVLQRLVADDPGGLGTALALRITAGDVEARRCAAVLLREVFTQNGVSLIPKSDGSIGQITEEDESQACPVWVREGLGETLLESFRSSVSEPTVRCKAADAVGTAAFRQFTIGGRAWPALTATLAKLCNTGARPEMMAVLELLEVLRDEAELAEDWQDNATVHPMTWVYAQLAALQKESGALHALLASALLDPAGEDTLAEPAARMFCLLVKAEAPEELRSAFRDLAPALAQAVVRHPGEALLQALALVVRDDPEMWGEDLGDLPGVLARAAMDSKAEPAARLAAMESLMQLLNASDVSGLSSTMDVSDSVEESEQLEVHTLTALAAVLAELPSPEATEWWAEVVDGETELEADDGDRSRAEESLLQEALDDACRLIRRSGRACSKLHAAALQLLQMEAWQAKHGGLLLLLRLAVKTSEDGEQTVDEQRAGEVSQAALCCFTNTNPRVRWAALEVCARLLMAGCRAPVGLISQMPQPLLLLCNDIYTRVRRRGLLVLLFSAQTAPHEMAMHGERIFKEVLIPHARDDDDSRAACRQIAEQLALVKDVPGGCTEEQRTCFQQELERDAVGGSYAFCEAQAAPAGRRMSMVRRKSSGLIMDEPAEQQYGQSIGTIRSGQAVGVVALMEGQPRSATALVSEPSEMLLVRKADFMRLIKEPMSRDWVEKDRFLQDHLVGIREHAKSFVPITGKSHATHMFAKKKYLPGHIFLHEGQVAEGALYVIFEGSVEFFRAASGTTAKLREAWRNPVMEQRKPLGLLQPTSAGVVAREYRLCAMLSGGLFGSASFIGGEKTTEEFSVIAGPKGCLVFESVGDNFQKLPLKVASAAREVLSKVAQVHQETCGVLLATLDSGSDENPAKLWKRTMAWQGNANARRASQSNPLLTSSKMQVGLPQGRRERDGPLTVTPLQVSFLFSSIADAIFATRVMIQGQATCRQIESLAGDPPAGGDWCAVLVPQRRVACDACKSDPGGSECTSEVPEPLEEEAAVQLPMQGPWQINLDLTLWQTLQEEPSSRKSAEDMDAETRVWKQGHALVRTLGALLVVRGWSRGRAGLGWEGGAGLHAEQGRQASADEFEKLWAEELEVALFRKAQRLPSPWTQKKRVFMICMYGLNTWQTDDSTVGTEQSSPKEGMLPMQTAMYPHLRIRLLNHDILTALIGSFDSLEPQLSVFVLFFLMASQLRHGLRNEFSGPDRHRKPVQVSYAVVLGGGIGEVMLMLQVRVVKCYGWEVAMEQKLAALRNKEVEGLRSYWHYTCGITALLVAFPRLLIWVGLVGYAAIYGAHDVATIFTSLQILACLRGSCEILATSLARCAGIAPSVSRIQAFLKLPEAPPVCQNGQLPAWLHHWSPTGGRDESLKVQGTFSWSTGPGGELVAIVGGVGSGKSALLQAILGELMPDETEVKAFVSRALGQVPSGSGEESLAVQMEGCPVPYIAEGTLKAIQAGRGRNKDRIDEGRCSHRRTQSLNCLAGCEIIVTAMAPSLCLVLAWAACAVAQDVVLAVTADEGPAVRIVNHVLLEAVVLLLIAVVALCALLVFLGRLLCCFRTGRQGLLDPLLIDDEPLLIDDEQDLEDAERHTNPDTSRSSSAQTARLSTSHGPRRCFQDLHVPTRIPIMRRILEARGRLSKKTELPREHRDTASKSSPKLLGRERFGSPPSRKARGSEVRKPSTAAAAAKNSSVRQPVSAPAPCKEPAERQADPATGGPMLYEKLFSQAAETEDLREVVYCNLAQPSTSFPRAAANMKRQAESQHVAGAQEQQSKVGRKRPIICYSLPLMGHVTPILSICNALRSKGHKVLFVSSAGLRKKLEDRCRRQGYAFRPLEDGMTEQEVSSIHPAAGPTFKDFTEKHGPLLAELIRAEEPIVVVADFASGAGLLQAPKMKVPLVINVPMPASLLKTVLLLTNPFISAFARRWHHGDRFAIEYLSDIGMPAVKSTTSIVNSSPAVELTGKTSLCGCRRRPARSASAGLKQQFEPVSLPPNVFVSGPLDGFTPKPLLEKAANHAYVLKFLKTSNSAKPLFYITTGTLLDLSEAQVLALYNGFASRDVRVIWSLKESKRSFLPESVSENFLIHHWMPQVEILSIPELTAVLTHCGWGGSLECMMAGKPVICFPGFGDQKQNARILLQKGCGTLLKPATLTAATVVAAVDDVLKKLETYRENASRVSDELRKSPGPQAVVEVIEKASKQGECNSLAFFEATAGFSHSEWLTRFAGGGGAKVGPGAEVGYVWALFSSPATTPRGRLPSDAENITPPRSSPGSTLTASTMEHHSCMFLPASFLSVRVARADDLSIYPSI